MIDDDIEDVVLTPEQLAHFTKPLTWPEIFGLQPSMRKAQWRAGVIHADEVGRGLLRWTPGPRVAYARKGVGGVWQITEAGAAFVARHMTIH